LIDLLEIQALRGRWVRALLLLVLALLWGRFFFLQGLSGQDYMRHSEANALRRIPVTAPRGLILDRDHRVLVDNRPSYSLFLIPYGFIADTAAVHRLAVITGLEVDEINLRLLPGRSAPFRPIRLLRDMDFDTLTRIEEDRDALPGVYVQVEPVRAYGDSVRVSHVLGYVGEVSATELGDENRRDLETGDLAGKQGIEKYYDVLLRGRRGYRYTLVDAVGREIDHFGGRRDVAAVPGRNLQLTLNRDLQRLAEMALVGKRGAIVALNPQNGEVLALASAPDFPLTVFARHLAPAVWQALIHDAGHPLLNRAIQAQLPPGSIYKPVTTLAGLETGQIDLSDTLTCTGGWPVGRRFYPCWKSEGHGPVSLIEALAQSCNSYFYRLSLGLEFEDWHRWGDRLGVGQKSGVDLPNEASGLLPASSYMDEKYGRGRWKRGQLANLAIGQGDLLVTPMQMAVLAALIGSGGRRVTPHLALSTETVDGGWRHIIPDSTVLPIDSRWIALIKAGMADAVNTPAGTAQAAKVRGVSVCGKTGSAQNPHGESHAWFMGFAPMEAPEIAIAVMVEQGGSGGRSAAPLAGSLLRHHFGTGSTDDR